MKTTVISRLELAFRLYDDLLAYLPEPALKEKLPGLPSNELGHQLWCVIGARHSYTKALKAGSWQGFECPLPGNQTGSSEAVLAALKATAQETLVFLQSGAAFPEPTLLELLEHEIQHHGQIIRYLYGLKLGVPDSWKKRYNLD